MIKIRPRAVKHSIFVTIVLILAVISSADVIVNANADADADAGIMKAVDEDNAFDLDQGSDFGEGEEGVAQQEEEEKDFPFSANEQEQVLEAPLPGDNGVEVEESAGALLANVEEDKSSVFNPLNDEKEHSSMGTDNEKLDDGLVNYDHVHEDDGIPLDEDKVEVNVEIENYPEPTDGELCIGYHYRRLVSMKKSAAICEKSELERLERVRNQPQYIQNYTEVGYSQQSLQDDLFEELSKFYLAEDPAFVVRDEQWAETSSHINYWSTTTKMKSVEKNLKDRVVAAVAEMVEQWIGKKVLPVASYGIRIYEDNAVIFQNVNQPPLALSVIINVVQEQVEDGWPLHLVDHQGINHIINMNPGSMIIYEGSSLPHGRPDALKGKYANMYIHFQPADLVNIDKSSELSQETLAKMYSKAFNKRPNLSKDDLKNGELPAYIKQNSVQERRWKGLSEGPPKPAKKLPAGELAEGSTAAHKYANHGRVEKLISVLDEDPDLVKAVDSNGWTALHEAAREGRLKTLKVLIERGADINKRTNQGRGGTALWWAEQSLTKGHPVIAYLKEKGAKSEGPVHE